MKGVSGRARAWAGSMRRHSGSSGCSSCESRVAHTSFVNAQILRHFYFRERKMDGTDADDAADVEDELGVLRAMFDDDELTIAENADGSTALRIPVVKVEPHLAVTLQVWLGANSAYPSKSAPPFLVDFKSRGLLDHAAEEALRDACSHTMSDLFEPGQVVIWKWVAALRELCAEVEERAQLAAASAASLATVQPPASPPAAPALRCAAPLVPAALAGEFSIAHSAKLEVKKSIFQAHAAHVRSTSDVRAVLAQLMSNTKIARATHNMVAYRIAGADEGVFYCDNDEDGEHGAGAKMSFLLDAMDARDVVVVVSRWYGGVHLGPLRFKVIANMAREIVLEGGWSARRT